MSPLPTRAAPLSRRLLPALVTLGAVYPTLLIVRGAVARPSVFLRNVLEGLSLGGVYALIALGYTMVYGVLGLINFAHSDVFMFGAYVGIFSAAFFGVLATSSEGAPAGVVFACLAASMLACAALGVTIERFAYRPIRKAPKLTPLVTAIGISMLLQNVAILVFGATPRGFPPIVKAEPLAFLGITITNIKLVDLGAALLMMVGLTLLVQKTRFGRAMRAISTNLEAARLMGVPIDRVIALTFGLGSALAGAGGILFGIDQPRVDPLSGVQPGLKAFVAAVLGGIGNIPGAMLGGLLIGLVEQLASAYLSSSFAPAIVFSILVVVLLVRPAGLLGKVTREKV
ncbi:MAG: branched-chain amino acid ABC transporter permease [Myxococcales bacterium]|nr:branched-chain amino acid ABC transporter permease [Myxococcales bacterium]